MRSLLNSLLVSVCCLCFIAFAPMTALADDLNETALLGEGGSVQLHITKECITDPEDIKPGAVVTYRVVAGATSEDLAFVFDPVIYDKLGSGLTLTSIDDLNVEGNIFSVNASESGNGFTMQLSDGVDPGFATEAGDCTFTYKAIVSDTAKAGDEIPNTITFEAYTDDLDNPDVVSCTETITVAGDTVPGGDEPGDVDSDDVTGDDTDNPSDNAKDAEHANLSNHSPDCGDHSLDILKIFCPILWIL